MSFECLGMFTIWWLINNSTMFIYETETHSIACNSNLYSFWYSRIIWLGDLNYRIALSYRSAKALVEMRNWRALLENDQVSFSNPYAMYECILFLRRFKIELWKFDVIIFLQLRIEQRHGRVFNGWNEGKIYFPPTYKYSNNSDRYAGEARNPKEKRRTPAWCAYIYFFL